MIGEDRPLCVIVPIDFQEYKYRELRQQLGETVDFEDDEVGRIAEACTAEWSKHEHDENGVQVKREELGYVLDVIHYVKCMEPAVYYMHIPHAMGGGVFCEFHKPRIREI